MIEFGLLPSWWDFSLRAWRHTATIYVVLTYSMPMYFLSQDLFWANVATVICFLSLGRPSAGCLFGCPSVRFNWLLTICTGYLLRVSWRVVAVRTGCEKSDVWATNAMESLPVAKLGSFVVSYVKIFLWHVIVPSSPGFGNSFLYCCSSCVSSPSKPRSEYSLLLCLRRLLICLWPFLKTVFSSLPKYNSSCCFLFLQG